MKASWKLWTLGDVCSFENGDRGKNYPSRSAQTSSGIPFINAGHLTDSGIDSENLNYIPRARFDLLSNGKIRAEDILFCLRGSLGKFASVGSLQEGAIASSLVIVRANDRVSPDFLLAYFKSDLCASMIAKFRSGTAQPNLSAASLREFTIPVPPLDEQKRIVQILDGIFEGIANVTANSESALQQSRNMVSSYFDASLNGRESWRMLPIYQCFKVRSGDFLSAKQMDTSGSVPVYGGNGITGHHIAANLDGDNVIIGRVGEKCGNVRNVRGPLWLTDNALYISELLQPLDPEFLAIRLEAENLRRTANQTAQPVISYSTIKNIDLSFPSTIPEQKSVVTSLNALNALVESLQSSIKAKISALQELKQSLLNQAFSGNL